MFTNKEAFVKEQPGLRITTHPLNDDDTKVIKINSIEYHVAAAQSREYISEIGEAYGLDTKLLCNSGYDYDHVNECITYEHNSSLGVPRFKTILENSRLHRSIVLRSLSLLNSNNRPRTFTMDMDIGYAYYFAARLTYTRKIQIRTNKNCGYWYQTIESDKDGFYLGKLITQGTLLALFDRKEEIPVLSVIIQQKREFIDKIRDYFTKCHAKMSREGKIDPSPLCTFNYKTDCLDLTGSVYEAITSSIREACRKRTPVIYYSTEPYKLFHCVGQSIKAVMVNKTKLLLELMVKNRKRKFDETGNRPII